MGTSEMIFLFFLALIIFGPKKLPEIGRQVGKALAEFKRASNEFKSQLEAEMRQIEFEETLKKEKEALTPSILPPAAAEASDNVANTIPTSSATSLVESSSTPSVPSGAESLEVSSPSAEGQETLIRVLPPSEDGISGGNMALERPSERNAAAPTSDASVHTIPGDPESPRASSHPAEKAEMKSETVQSTNG